MIKSRPVVNRCSTFAMPPRNSGSILPMKILVPVWLGSCIAVPITTAMLLGFHFTIDCPSDVYIEAINDYTTPKRIFAIFICIELVLTRVWCVKELYLLWSAAIPNNSDTTPTVVHSVPVLRYVWSSVITSLALDAGTLAWVFLANNACSGMSDYRKIQTLEPLCVMTTDVDIIVTIIHIANMVLLLLVAINATKMYKARPHEK